MHGQEGNRQAQGALCLGLADSRLRPSIDRADAAACPIQAPQALTGLIERVTFHSPETGFCVLRIRLRGRRELATLVGHGATASPGEFVEAEGAWVHDRTHGLQFRADRLRTTPPTTPEGIERFLGSGLIRGVGPVTARKLVRAFGPGVLELIESTPDRLREVAGIGPLRARRIVAGWADQRVIREIVLFLHAQGVGTSRALRIHRAYGAEAIRLVRENPYRLARDIHGIGFRTADRIAASLGLGPEDPARVRAGITWALQAAMDEGHCGLPEPELLRRAAELLEVPESLVHAALAQELAERAVVADSLAGEPGIFLAGLYGAEKAIAARLRRLATGAPPWPALDPDRAIPWVEAETGLALAESQRAALRLALGSRLLAITGGPGVGKTTLLRALLLLLRARGVEVALCAPTGRAARRLSDATGLPAQTIHRLLEATPQGGFRRGRAEPLACGLLVLDEASMVDVPLMHALLRALPDQAALLLVGDVDQLPSVGPGQVLADALASGAVPAVRLTEVFRQAAASRIVTNAHRINRGLLPEAPPPGTPSDFHLIEAADADAVLRKLLLVVGSRIPARFGLDPVRDVQVLCPMNRGTLGARALNLELQRLLNPALQGPDRVERFGWTFCPGDKVMQTENDYEREVFNGDLGLIRRLDRENGELVVGFDGREVAYPFAELDTLSLAYATTIHKSQGSEYPAVVIPLLTRHAIMLARNLLYTGVTRGRRLVVLIGQSRALRLAVRNAGRRRRWTRLGEWLAQGEGERGGSCAAVHPDRGAPPRTAPQQQSRLPATD